MVDGLEHKSGACRTEINVEGLKCPCAPGVCAKYLFGAGGSMQRQQAAYDRWTAPAQRSLLNLSTPAQGTATPSCFRISQISQLYWERPLEQDAKSVPS